MSYKPSTLLTTISGLSRNRAGGPRYITSEWTAQKTPLPTVTPLLRVTQPLPGSGSLSDYLGLSFGFLSPLS
jgi:hypothetical protein